MKKITLRGGETKFVKFIIEPIDYADKLKEFATIYLEVSAIAGRTMSRTEKKFSLAPPSLSINAPKTVGVNQTFHVNLQFKNPLNLPLKHCYIVVEGNRLERRIFPMPDIPPLSIGKTTMTLHTLYPFKERIIVSFHSAYLREVIDVVYVQVTGTQKHSFSYYTKTPQYQQQSHQVTRQQSSMIGGIKDTSVNIQALASSSNKYHCCNIIYF
ncbi:hemocyte protein-glutamine gamma-glutamyltransferase-like isoform X2 [Leptotrombidium deliense]|uniref:Hemocyte protein-glutamine gamma-glutamyltransferase-like isoform X2 n=1 Tax=Leptotrombidium deliense TaxID=299467 RepID=A0A443S9C3_9ACAR|nr:hemocyte protein-glutamine gamma-glutamyltransferase-like isoform X2 [Leptotrombidium deliense]